MAGQSSSAGWWAGSAPTGGAAAGRVGRPVVWDARGERRVVGAARGRVEARGEGRDAPPGLPLVLREDVDAEPRLGVDVFPENEWKAGRSVAAFAAGLDPAACCSYDAALAACVPDYWTSHAPRGGAACGGGPRPPAG